MEKKAKKIDMSNMSALIVLIVLRLFLSIIQPAFHSFNNIINILQQVTVYAVLALGVNVVIFTGGIDISVGSVVAFTGIVMGKLVVEGGMPSIVGVLAALIIGALCGTFNGIMISKFKLQPMIATLAMMSMARGAALTLADGETITGYSDGFRWIGNGTIPGTSIPVQIIFMVLLYILFYYIMKYRKFGRYIYSIGGNEEATRLSGINVVKYKTLAYTLSGLCAGIASIILVSKLNSAQSTAGLDYEMDAIASCVIGGTSLLGGFGNVWGTFVGAIILSAADSKSLVPAIVKANNANIPVILVNDTIDEEALEADCGHVETYVGINQYDAAKLAGDYAAENIKDGKVCCLEGISGVAALEDRLNGFADAVDFEVAASQTAKCDRNEAFNVMQNVLSATPDVNVVWAVNAEMGQGAIQVIEQGGFSGKVQVFDFDASSDDLEAIEAGTLTGTVAQYPNIQASTAIQCCLDVLDGKTLDAHTETKAQLITKDNLEDYKAEMGE